jgi:hypothetical protein
MIKLMKLIAKHLPLLALALLVSSTELRADDFPLQVGDIIKVEFSNKVESRNNFGQTYKITKIKGKWFEAQIINFGGTPIGYEWVNSDHLTQVVKLPQ